MVWWRFKTPQPTAYRFGYVTYETGYSMIRMGCWNGDTMGGAVVDATEIEWKPYR